MLKVRVTIRMGKLRKTYLALPNALAILGRDDVSG
jgi:hypothetical protein